METTGLTTNQAQGRAAVFDPASLHCEAALPTTRLVTSAEVGWTSALVVLHRDAPFCDPFETHLTSDQTIVVGWRGVQHLESYSRGCWRRATTRVGSVGLTPGGETSRLRWTSPSDVEAIETAHLYLPQAVLLGVAEEYRRLGAPLPEVPLSALCYDDLVVAGAVAGLVEAARRGASDLYCATTTLALATHLLFRHSSAYAPDTDSRRPGIVSEPRLLRAVEYMRANLAEPLTLDRLADEAGVSKFHFSRLFRERMGETPHAMLARLRLEMARDLLLRTDRRVDDISKACGYSQAAHFSTAFRAKYGQSPSLFRKSQKP